MDIRNSKVIQFIALCFCIVISGCERQAYTKATFIDGYFQTPSGKYKFKNVSLKKAKNLRLKDYDRLYSSYLIAEDDEIRFSYCSACGNLKIYVFLPSRYRENRSIFKVRNKDAQYKIGDSEYKPMLHKRDNDGNIIDIEHAIARTKIPVDVLGPGKTGDNIGHIKFSFKIDEDKYHVNLSLKVEKSHRLKFAIGIPGTP